MTFAERTLGMSDDERWRQWVLSHAESSRRTDRQVRILFAVIAVAAVVGVYLL